MVAVIVGTIASGLRVAWTGKMTSRSLFELRVRLFAHLQRLSLDYFTDEKAGVIMTRLTSDIEAIQQFLQEGLAEFLVQGLTMVIVTAVLFSYNVKLALLTVLVIVPILTALSLWFRSASDRGYQRVRDGIATVLSDLAESLAGVRVVVGFNRERHNVLHHREVTAEYREANDHTALLSATYAANTEFIGLLGQAMLLLVGGNMVRNGQLQVGELAAFVLYLNSFFQPIQQLVQQYTLYQQSKAAIVKLNELLTTRPSVEESPTAVRAAAHPTGKSPSTTCRSGTTRPNPVLEDVSLTIAAGETISFVGPTGAGKSTLAKLVIRFYDPTAGRVLIDGYDLSDGDPALAAQQARCGPPRAVPLRRHLRDNIVFARPDAPDDAVVGSASSGWV